MTASTEPVAVAVRLDFDTHAAAFSKAMSHLDNAATKELDRVGFDRRLRELVRIRAAQLNGCAYCVDMHTKDARAAGETDERLIGLPVWAETPYFTARERAALAFTETVICAAQTRVPDDAYAAVAQHFSAEEVAALVSLIVVINAWTTIGVTTRAWTAGSYQP
jgi:AhpD family alkylhydroperoxidase